MRRSLEDYDAARERRIRERIVALTNTIAPGWIELQLAAPEVPPGVVLVLQPSGSGGERAPLDATLLIGDGRSHPLADDRPVFLVDHPPSRASLLRQLELIRQQRAAAVARRVMAAVCLCRNHILEVDRSARLAYEERVRELAARRVDQAEVIHREQSAAHLPVARHAEQIVHDAAARLERLLVDVRAAWKQRVESCGGIEQLRAEVAAIEDGAVHRLALVCDELRETMTIQFVRLVLELSRSLRQELSRKRLEVARGRSPKLEQPFDDIRVVLPASLDKTFGALSAPGVGELLSGERNLFDPLFRTLAREKRECIARLYARLDEIEQTTQRDLYAAAVYVSPLLLSTFKGLVAELVTAHQYWIDDRIAEEERAWQAQQARHAPVVEMVAPLEAAESKLAALLEGAGV